MDRKMRAKRNNAEAKAKKERRCRGPMGIVFTEQHEGTEVNRLILPTGDTVPVLIDHDSKTFESLPEKSEMN